MVEEEPDERVDDVGQEPLGPGIGEFAEDVQRLGIGVQGSGSTKCGLTRPGHCRHRRLRPL
jgi:hypothetical protein